MGDIQQMLALIDDDIARMRDQYAYGGKDLDEAKYLRHQYAHLLAVVDTIASELAVAALGDGDAKDVAANCAQRIEAMIPGLPDDDDRFDPDQRSSTLYP